MDSSWKKRRQRKALQREIMQQEGWQPAVQQAKPARRRGSGLLVFLVVLLLVLAGFLVWLITSNTLSFGPSGIELNMQGDQVWATEKQLVPLLETQDAGQEYIDGSLFVGDSNTLRLTQFNLANNVAAMESIGIRAVRTESFVGIEGETGTFTIPQLAGRIKPERVVMAFGTNDISDSMSVESYIEEYKAAIAAVREESGSSAIIVCAIFPFEEFNSYPNLSLEMLQQCNEALRQMCEEEQVGFLDTNEALAGEDGYMQEGFTDADGIHLNEAGLQAFLEYYRTHALV